MDPKVQQNSNGGGSFFAYIVDQYIGQHPRPPTSSNRQLSRDEMARLLDLDNQKAKLQSSIRSKASDLLDKHTNGKVEFGSDVIADGVASLRRELPRLLEVYHTYGQVRGIHLSESEIERERTSAGNVLERPLIIDEIDALQKLLAALGGPINDKSEQQPGIKRLNAEKVAALKLVLAKIPSHKP